MGQTFHEEHPIRQACQPIRDFPLRDIGLRSGHTRDVASVVAHSEPPTEHPAIRAVLVQHAMLVFEMCGLSREVHLERCLQPLAVLRMDTGQPHLEAVLDVALLTTQHLFPAGGKKHVVRAQIPIPQSVLRPTHGQGIPLFALAQGLFGLLTRQLGINAGKDDGEIDGFRHVVIGSQT